MNTAAYWKTCLPAKEDTFTQYVKEKMDEFKGKLENEDGYERQIVEAQMDAFIMAVSERMERMEKLKKLNESLKKMEAPQTSKDDVILAETLKKNEEEKLRPYKKQLRMYRERLEAEGQGESVLSDLKERYTAMIKKGEMTPEGVLFMHPSFEGSLKEKATMVKLMMQGRLKDAIAENNIRYLSELERKNPARALAVGNKVVACPYPLLWEGVPEAVSANIELLESVEDAPLTGGAANVEASVTSMKWGINGIFKVGGSNALKGKVALPRPLLDMIQKSARLSGGGIAFRVNEDGTVSMDELEKAIADMSATQNFLIDRLSKYEADTNHKLQYLLNQGNALQQQQQATYERLQQGFTPQANVDQRNNANNNNYNNGCRFCGKMGHIARNCFRNPASAQYKGQPKNVQ